jgi:hypothetical protein
MTVSLPGFVSAYFETVSFARWERGRNLPCAAGAGVMADPRILCSISCSFSTTVGENGKAKPLNLPLTTAYQLSYQMKK